MCISVLRSIRTANILAAIHFQDVLCSWLIFSRLLILNRLLSSRKKLKSGLLLKNQHSLKKSMKIYPILQKKEKPDGTDWEFRYQTIKLIRTDQSKKNFPIIDKQYEVYLHIRG